MGAGAEAMAAGVREDVLAAVAQPRKNPPLRNTWTACGTVKAESTSRKSMIFELFYAL